MSAKPDRRVLAPARKPRHGRHAAIIALLMALACGTSRADWRAPREALEERARQGSVAIYYTRQGEHAMAPELVPALRQQLAQASRFFEQGLGLQSPLGSARYRGDLGSIDLHVLRMQEGRNGSAGDAAVRYRYRQFGANEGKALTLTIGAHWTPPNLTPAHELFHAYQYGYTFFKNAWFLEGLARALEPAMAGESGGATQPLPRDIAQWRALTRKSYAAQALWRRLMALCEPACRPAQGEPFAAPCGASLVRATLEAFDAADAEAGAARGLDPHDWPEEEQRSAANDPYMANGLQNAIAHACPAPRAQELQAFEQLMEAAASKAASQAAPAASSRP